MADQGSRIDGKLIAQCVARFRARKPHVHCITNSVAQHFTANVLLAAGGTPSMTIAEAEIGSFVEMADALLVNLGTMDAERIKAVDVAVEVADLSGKPWALDPVFVQASPGRLDLARSLLERQPTIIRCNANEGRVLLEVEPDITTLQNSARELSTTIALTGASDAICNEHGVVRIANGHQFMDRITAMGCALTALIAGFSVMEEERLLATASAIALFGLAGEVTGKKSEGPGTFVPSFLDALNNLSSDEIEKGVKLS